MPLFYIHLRTPDGLDEDDVGLPFPNLESAYLEAYQTIPAMAGDLMRKGLNPIRYTFVIADAAGVVLTEVPFSEGLGDGRPRQPPVRSGHSRRLSQEIAQEITRARETAARSREILARARALTAR